MEIIDISWLYSLKNTLLQSEAKAPFSTATTPTSTEGANPFPWLLHFILTVLIAQQGSLKYHFLSVWFDSTKDWTPGFPTSGEHSCW